MLPFFVLFIYLALVAAVSSKLPAYRKRKVQTIAGGLGLWLLLALRSWTCGNDLYVPDGNAIGYIPYFLQMSDYSLMEILTSVDGYETGYNIYNRVVAYITLNPQMFLAITAAIELLLIGYTIYKHSHDVIFSYLIFACLGLYIFSFSGLRQALGISVTFYAFNFINQKRPFIFILLVLLAYSLHTSALLFMPAIFFRNKIFNRNKAVPGLLVILALSPFLMTVIQYGALFVYGTEKYVNDSGGAFGLLALFIIIYLFSIYISDPQCYDNENSQIKWMILLAIILQTSGLYSAGAMARIAYYYSIFFCLLLPDSLKDCPIVAKKQYTLLISLLLIAFFIYSNHSGYLNVVPYRFFWEEIYLL